MVAFPMLGARTPFLYNQAGRHRRRHSQCGRPACAASPPLPPTTSSPALRPFGRGPAGALRRRGGRRRPRLDSRRRARCRRPRRRTGPDPYTTPLIPAPAPAGARQVAKAASRRHRRRRRHAVLWDGPGYGMRAWPHTALPLAVLAPARAAALARGAAQCLPTEADAADSRGGPCQARRRAGLLAPGTGTCRTAIRPTVRAGMPLLPGRSHCGRARGPARRACRRRMQLPGRPQRRGAIPARNAGLGRALAANAGRGKQNTAPAGAFDVGRSGRRGAERGPGGAPPPAPPPGRRPLPAGRRRRRRRQRRRRPPAPKR